ncbi:Uridine-cytidine kinase 2 [Boothiomyces sp. JEL0866]|nr:Uridine-cytidine kinase 2 [Boothiomyces sp. JEL0866]
MDCCISPKQDKKRLSFNPSMQMSPNPTQNKPFLIAIAGGPAAGKKQISEELSKTLPISIVYLESFYKELDETQLELVAQNEYNFDHPEALDYPLLLSTLESISNGNATSIPIYDFKTKKRIGHDIIQPSVCIVSGALILYHKQIRDLFDLKIFVDLDSDSRVSKLIERSTVSVDQMINKYMKFIKPSFEEFVLPSKKYADVVIPRGEENEVALDLIKEHINDILNKK